MNWFINMINLTVLSFAITRLLIPLCIYFAYKFKVLDVPDGVIKHHAAIVPYLGGVAIFLGLCGTSIFFVQVSFQLLLFYCASLFLVVLGLIDDIAVLKPSQKFLGQCLSVICFLYAGFYFNILVFPFWVNIALSFLWILTLINAFNLIDVMDGLSSTVALCASVCFLGVALYGGNYNIAVVLTCAIGALVAFLSYNFPPARMYLGDAGSLFLGGLFGALPLGLYSADIHGYISYVIVVAIPLIELITLVFIRTYKGIPFYKGSPDHFSLYLLRNGWAKKSILMYVLVMMSCLATISTLFLFELLSVPHIVVLACIFLVVWTVVLIFPLPCSRKITY